MNLPFFSMLYTVTRSSKYFSGSSASVILDTTTSSMESLNAENTGAFFFNIFLASFILPMSASLPAPARIREPTTMLIPISITNAPLRAFLLEANKSNFLINSGFIIIPPGLLSVSFRA